MVILGLNDSNSAAAIIKDGQLIAAAREERFDRIKFSDSYPTQAVNFCLNEVGINLKEVDHVVFAWNPGHELEPQGSSAAVRHHKDFLHYIPNNLLAHIGGDKVNKKITSVSEIIQFQEGSLNIHFAPHHFSHAASAFFISPYEKAAVLTIDALGDDITEQFYIGEGNKLTPISKTLFPHSMGHVYAAITQYLGYRANVDEWKVMGLAAYGEPEYYEKFSKIIRFDKDREGLRFNLDYFSYFLWNPRRYSDLFVETFGPERHFNDEINKRHINLATSFQKCVEDVVLEMVIYFYEKTRLDSLCLAGGVAMNSKMNGRILQESPFKNVWLPSSADDAGCSLGACFFYWNQVLGHERQFVLEHDYWGPGFTNDDIKNTLENSLVSHEYLEHPEEEAARSIANNKIIGWFQGKMEFGQRALGNRSILADPRDPDMKDKINRLIKHREWYRPFAPSVLQEFQKDYFETDQPVPFMEKVALVREEKQKEIAAVVHEDGTGRLQTITRQGNPSYWKLIDEFRKITNTPVVLNTSFNDNEEPIVCTPKDAIRSFFGSGLHELYIGNYRVCKPL